MDLVKRARRRAKWLRRRIWVSEIGTTPDLLEELAKEIEKLQCKCRGVIKVPIGKVELTLPTTLEETLNSNNNE